MSGALSDVRILDFSHMVAGPYATLLLSYFGAQVIKVESARHPDGFRIREGSDLNNSRPFADFNRNKLGVTFNLKSPRGRELMLRAAARCDVVVENFAVGVMDRLGMSYEALRKVRPDIIMISMPGLGRTGPNREWVSWGPNIQHWVGMSHLWTEPGQCEPVGSQASHPDYISGLHGAVAIMAALHHRVRTGQGQCIDLAQAECAASLLGPAYLEVLIAGRDPQRCGNADPLHSPHGIYPCAGTDRWLAVAVRTDTEWRSFCETAEDLGAPGADWQGDARFRTAAGRVEHRAAMDEAIAAWTRSRDAHDIAQCLQSMGVPASPVMTGSDLFHDPHLKERGFILPVEHPAMTPLSFPGVPVRLSRTPGRMWRHAPLLGQDTEQLCTGLLGLSPAEVESLRADGSLT